MSWLDWFLLVLIALVVACGAFVAMAGLIAMAHAGCLDDQVYNGRFDNWPAAQFVTPAPGVGTRLAHGWYGGPGVGGAWIVSRGVFPIGAELPADDPPRYYLHIQWTMAGATDGDATSLENAESQGVPPCQGGVRKWAGRTVTIEYWARAQFGLTLTPIIWQSFGRPGATCQCSPMRLLRAAPLRLTRQWQRSVATFVVPSLTGQVISMAGNDTLGFGFNTYPHMGWLDVANVDVVEVR